MVRPTDSITWPDQRHGWRRLRRGEVGAEQRGHGSGSRGAADGAERSAAGKQDALDLIELSAQAEIGLAQACLKPALAQAQIALDDHRRAHRRIG